MTKCAGSGWSGPSFIGSQSAGDLRHKPGRRLSLLYADHSDVQVSEQLTFQESSYE